MVSWHFIVEERHIMTGSLQLFFHTWTTSMSLSLQPPYQTSDNFGVPFRLHSCFIYFIQFKGFVSVLLLFMVLIVLLSFHSLFTDDIWALTWIHFYHDVLICVDIHFCSTDGTCSVWLQKIQHIGFIYLFNSAAGKKDGDWCIYPYLLASGNLNNAHQNIQKHSKTFKPSVHNFDSTWTNTAKNAYVLVLYRLC